MKIRNIILTSSALMGSALATPAWAAAGLSFIISGDTFSQPYNITNASTAGEKVIGFGLTLKAPFGFDTANGGFGIDSSTGFAPQGGSSATTGYTGPASFADGVNSIAFTFNNFDAGEAFNWLIDVDQPGVATVFGEELIGSAAYADFSNGWRASGFLQPVETDPGAAQFVVRAFTALPAIPEPGTWTMILLGFGAIGYAMRGRREHESFA